MEVFLDFQPSLKFFAGGAKAQGKLFRLNVDGSAKVESLMIQIVKNFGF